MTDTPTFAGYATRFREFIRQHLAVQPYEQSDAGFNELALGLFSLQFEHVRVYRQFCQGRQVTPATVRRWDQIPALPVSAFKEFEISSLRSEERTTTFHSSGTTGGKKPSRHFHNSESLKLYEASLRPWFHQHVLGDLADLTGVEGIGSLNNLGFVILTPTPALAPRSSLAHMFETVRREFGSCDSIFAGGINEDGTWSLDNEAALFAIRKSICANRPVALLGTAFSFVHLLDYFVVNNLRYHLAEGSRVMETGGYKGRSRSMPKTELHGLVTKYLGVPETHIVCEYGMSELSSQAYDRKIADCRFHIAEFASSRASRVFRFPPWVRVQIVSPETSQPVNEGEAGLICIFDLANVRSVLAIQTEDLGRRCGDGFELIGRAALAEPRGCSLTAH